MLEVEAVWSVVGCCGACGGMNKTGGGCNSNGPLIVALIKHNLLLCFYSAPNHCHQESANIAGDAFS